MYLSLCDNGCGNTSIRFTKKGKAVCSIRPAGCPAVLQKMKETSLQRYGVPNASSSSICKEQRRQKVLQKYGVDNVSKAPIIKQRLSKQKETYWNAVYDNKKFTVEGLTRNQYRHRCQQYANTQYERYKNLLDPDNQRGKHWHLDHIYSVTDGFLNDVPINIISDISNLRLISDKENYKKHKKSEKTLEELYEGFLNKNS
jgi:CHAT domain-containing protein